LHTVAIPGEVLDCHPWIAVNLFQGFGGAPDIAARLLGQYFAEATGQSTLIENRGGPTAI
jgi:hypothetical protein